ncbi:hypothetical protein [Rhodococcoides fascians]|uniref:hypothetical protein n=1 Tax=Rhodococcoides fascians TaxID=1828 RepID=UPI00114062A0|nr:hypothetical protein [Rhodococcus fascians]
MATAREKQDVALADYRRAKEHEQGLADVRGQTDADVPLVVDVDVDDAELQVAVDADVSAQEALSVALRAVDD